MRSHQFTHRSHKSHPVKVLGDVVRRDRVKVDPAVELVVVERDRDLGLSAYMLLRLLVLVSMLVAAVAAPFVLFARMCARCIGVRGFRIAPTHFLAAPTQSVAPFPPQRAAPCRAAAARRPSSATSAPPTLPPLPPPPFPPIYMIPSRRRTLSRGSLPLAITSHERPSASHPPC